MGPLVFEFAAVRVWGIRHRKPGPPSWLLIRRSLEDEPEVKYYISNAEASRDPAVDAGPGGLHAVPGGGVLRGLQELPRDDAVRDAVVGRVAPPHDAGGPGAPVRDADAAAAQKKLRS